MAYYWNKNGDVMDREIRRKESVTFFRNLRLLAEENGLTNKELADVLEIHQTYIPKYVSGKTVPREDAFESMKRRAIDFFDVSVEELFNDNFKNNSKKIVIAKPVKEEEKPDTTVLSEMTSAINKRKELIAQLSKEIDALEQALTLMQADKLS